jgi:hypothetical protein
LKRIHKNDIRAILQQPNDIRKIPEEHIQTFYSPFTYIYSAYLAESSLVNPVADCIHQLHRMGCFESSWYYHLVLVVGEGTSLNEIDGEEIGIHFEGIKTYHGERTSYYDDCTKAFTLAIRTSTALKKNSVQLFCLCSFKDRCPLQAEFNFSRAITSFDKTLVNNAYLALLKSIDEVKYDTEARTKILQAEIRRDVANWGTIPVCIPEGMTAENIILFAEFMKGNGASPLPIFWDCCVHLHQHSDNPLSDAQIDGMITLMEWAVQQGADPSFVKNTQSPLDLARAIADEYQTSVTAMQLKRIENVILKYGGKTAEEVLIERRTKKIIAREEYTMIF